MRLSLVVLRKEILEIAGDRDSLSGLFIQGGIVFLLAGIVVPALSSPVWGRAGELTMLYCGFPGVVAAMVAADAFAGERERRTIETLLATPIPAGSILAGKVAAATLFSVAVSWSSVLASIAAANLRSGSAPLLLPRPEELFWACGLALGYSLLMAAIAAGISLRLSVARSAQQVASILSLALGMACSELVEGGAVDWTKALGAGATLVALAALVLFLVVSAFRRDRLLGRLIG